MFKSLQRRYLLKKIDRNLKNRDLSNLNNKAITLGFLVDEDLFNDFEKLYAISERMGLHCKDVKIFTFMNVKKKLPSLRQNQINNKEFSWKGIIQNQNTNEFLALPLDVLVGYYKGKNYFLDLMMSKSKAKFKVGFNGVDSRLFDLIIDVNPLQVEKFGQELIKYLRILNKIN